MAFKGEQFSNPSFEGWSTTSHDDNECDVVLLGERRLPPRPRSHRGPLALRIVLCVTALISTTLIPYNTFAARATYTTEPIDFGDCGSSDTAEEGRAKGCVFDPMGWVWVRPECFNREMVHEYLDRGKFTFHTDPKLTPESMVPIDIIFRGDHPKLFTQKSYYSIYCIYIWRRIQKAAVENLPIDSYPTLPDHVNNCEKVLLNEVLHEDTECTPEMGCAAWTQATWTSCKKW
ncbi:hypothetical protein E0Z10_g3252 [Xylaria hypoxylon]|uniref:Uncharacterized protein n=1 Tax=Xylaria hypoxylon TaxID=37992 RepID=A0A4Z0ZA90_9PEZI|nr:hypothetical protein E0Z10_g3252 [Xylaria hypoxylon]